MNVLERIKMRNKFFYIVFSVSILLGNIVPTLAKTPYHRVLSCKMASGDKIILKVIHITDNQKYFLNGDKPFLEINGKTHLAFANSIRDDMVGDIYLAKCVKHTLIFAMGQVSAYLSGVAIRQNPVTHQYERIYFAEKALPHWLYFKNNEWGIIIPNIGYETDKQYLVYTYKRGKNQPELQHNMKGLNTFPVPKKSLIRIPIPKDLQ